MGLRQIKISHMSLLFTSEKTALRPWVFFSRCISSTTTTVRACASFSFPALCAASASSEVLRHLLHRKCNDTCVLTDTALPAPSSHSRSLRRYRLSVPVPSLYAVFLTRSPALYILYPNARLPFYCLHNRHARFGSDPRPDYRRKLWGIAG